MKRLLCSCILFIFVFNWFSALAADISDARKSLREITAKLDEELPNQFIIFRSTIDTIESTALNDVNQAIKKLTEYSQDPEAIEPQESLDLIHTTIVPLLSTTYENQVMAKYAQLNDVSFYKLNNQ